MKFVPKWFFVDRKKFWKKQEERISKEIKGNVQPGSGNTDWEKLDVVSDNWVVEAKSTNKLSYRITSDLIKKVKKFGCNKNKKWVIEISLKNRNGKDEIVYIISREDFFEYRKLLNMVK